MKIAFTSCVQLGKSCIEKILEMNTNIDLLITLKDEKAKDKSGRIYLDDISEKYDIPLLKINNINEDIVIQTLKEKEIDWLFIIGWSQIAKKELLDTPKKGCIGMHPTLLPMGRGRAAVPWAILKGLDKTGVTMFKLNEGVDTGEILGQVEIPLEEDVTATTLYQRVDNAHITLIEKYLEDIVNDTITLREQDEKQATEWPGRKPEDGKLDSSMTKVEADRLVRAVTRPYPGAFYFDENGNKIIVWSARVSDEPAQETFKLADGYLNPIEYEKEDS